MNILPRRRSSRNGRGRARLTPVPGIPADGIPPQGPGFAESLRRELHAAADQLEPRSDGLERIRARVRSGPADGTTWTLPGDGQGVVIFEGASEIGLMPPGVVAIKDWGRDTQPLAFRIPPGEQP